MSGLRLRRDPWFYTTWKGAEIRTLLEGAAMSLPEKLAWLEEVTEFGRGLQARAATIDAARECTRDGCS